MTLKTKKECFFQKNKIKEIHYTDIEVMNKFLDINGKIMPRRRTGLSSKAHRSLNKTIKRARFMGLLPYIKV